MSSDQTATVVVAAVIVLEGRVLLKEITNPEHREGLRGKWEFPGGVVNFGEDLDAALCREVKEELGLEVRVGRLLHAQVNSYITGTDYLVLFHACTLLAVPDWEYITPVKLLSPSELCAYDVLPGTLEAVRHLGEVTTVREEFSFVQNYPGEQSPGETLHIMTYELGKVIEYYHKAKRCGETGYYSEANQQKETSDLISMLRYYCEQRGWDYDELMKLGERAYLDRMDDLRKHGTQERCPECGRTLPMHNPECSQYERWKEGS